MRPEHLHSSVHTSKDFKNFEKFHTVGGKVLLTTTGRTRATAGVHIATLVVAVGLN